MIRLRTRGGPTQGWGNIHRLAAFADYCRSRGHDELQFLAEGPPAIADYLSRRGFDTIALRDDVTLEEEQAILDGLPRSSVTVVEMLDCHPKRQALLRSHTDRLVVVDDLMDHRFGADLVICGQSLPHYGNIAISHPETRFLTGYDYFIFSPAYRAYAEKVRQHGERVAEVLVAFGGGRYDVAYLKAAAALAALGQGIRATFILGFAAEEQLKQELAAILPDAILLGGVEDMPERLAAADLAVVSAGYLKLEAAMVGTPVVMVATQWHQMPLAEEFTRHTGTPYAGYMGFAAPETLEEALSELLPKERRAALAAAMRSVVDGRGIERVYDAIFTKGASSL